MLMPELNVKKATYSAREDALRYIKAAGVLQDLRTAWRWKNITSEQYKTMRVRALEGEQEEVTKELARIMGRRM